MQTTRRVLGLFIFTLWLIASFIVVEQRRMFLLNVFFDIATVYKNIYSYFSHTGQSEQLCQKDMKTSKEKRLIYGLYMTNRRVHHFRNINKIHKIFLK